MRLIRWLWEGSPLVNGLILGLVLVAVGVVLGVCVSPYWFVAAIVGAALLWVAALVIFQALRFALMAPNRRQWRLRMFQTNYARRGGWYVERDGRRLALLTDPRLEEMFWESYVVTPLADEPAERERIGADPSWWLQPGLEFRSREFDIVAPSAFVAGSVYSAPGRVLMRGLYLYIGPPTMWERFWLRWFARTKQAEPSAATDGGSR